VLGQCVPARQAVGIRRPQTPFLSNMQQDLRLFMVHAVAFADATVGTQKRFGFPNVCPKGKRIFHYDYTVFHLPSLN
jgi:hypothetical protein